MLHLLFMLFWGVCSLFRYLPGDLFQFKTLHELHNYLDNEYWASIREHVRRGVPDKPRDLIDAFLKKLQEEQHQKGSVFAGLFPCVSATL